MKNQKQEINIITNPEMKLFSTADNKRLFSVVPTINFDYSVDGALMQDTSEQYDRVFRNASKASCLIAEDTDKLIVCSHLSTLLNKEWLEISLKMLRDSAKKIKKSTLSAFLDNLEFRLNITINNGTADILAIELESLMLEVYIETLQDIESIFKTTAEGISDKCPELYAAYYRASSWIFKIINGLIVNKNNHMNPTFTFKHFPVFDQYNVMNIALPTDRSESDKIQNIYDDARELSTCIVANRNTALASTEFYYIIRRVLLTVFGNDDVHEGMPYYQTVLAALDGYGIFHLFHEKLMTVYEYAFTVIKAYKDSKMLERPENEHYCDDDWD